MNDEDPQHDVSHCVQQVHQHLGDVISEARTDVERVDDPRARALLETTAEVLTGLSTAYRHYLAGEPAWR
jgi:hypothetical protein